MHTKQLGLPKKKSVDVHSGVPVFSEGPVIQHRDKGPWANEPKHMSKAVSEYACYANQYLGDTMK